VNERLKQAALLLLMSVLLFSAIPAYAGPARQPAAVTGWLSIVWPDPRPGKTPPVDQEYLLSTDDGETIRLLIPEPVARAAGGVFKLDGKRVRVAGLLVANPNAALHASLDVQSIQLAPGSDGAPLDPEGVTGSQPWVSILCKFADKSAEPKTLSYFQGMYGSSYPGLDHYWREVSFNNVNVAGSNAVGWYTLPQPYSYYVYDNNGDGSVDLDFDRATTDCLGVADAAVNFANFVGVNLMFNDDLGCCAYGGGHFMNRDGVERVWHMTWEPPWGYTDITVMGHEMGHGFGLPHSSGQYGATYDNQWDVMSDTWSNCDRSTDPVYGCLGQHTISPHKDQLGWIAPAEKFTATGGQSTITLEQLALPQTSNYKMAQIPIDGATRFYTVEARRQNGYDYKLPGQGVIIHEVDLTRSRPAQVVDADNNGNTGDAGAIWTPGETFVDAANVISVAINSATATGWVVTINSRAASATTLVSSDESSVVGQSVTFTATVTSGATGNVAFLDGDTTLATVALSGNHASYTTSALSAGTHQITARYTGNGIYGASTSATVQQEVLQASVTTLGSSANPSAYGATFVLTATVTGGATGYVAFSDGANIFAYVVLTGGVATTEVSWFQAGTHWLTAQYLGDGIYVPSTSAVLYQVVQPEAGAPTGVVATATSSTQVSLTWNPVPNTSFYYIDRYANGTSTFAGAPATAAFVDSGLAPNTTYFYYVTAYSTSGVYSPWSMPEPATTVIFTNDPLATGTSIKAVHLTQLRTAVNAFRATAGLPAVTFTDASITAGSTTVKAAHITELRAAIDGARAGWYFPPAGYTGAIPGPGTPVRAANVQELRNGTK
jgi:hypothetical protein